MTRTVFHVVDSLSIGGAERMAVDVSNGLAARGWDVHLIATRELGPLADEVDAAEVSCLHRTSRWDLNGIRRFRMLIREQQPDVVHAHGWSSMQFCTAALMGTRTAPALVFHDHRGAGLSRLNASYRLAAWVSTRAHVVVDRDLLEPSLRTRRDCIRAVVPNGVPLARFAHKSSYALSVPPKLVMLANLRSEKNHPCLFDAVARLRSWGTPVSVNLIGALVDVDYVAVCRDAIESAGLGDCTTLVGARTDAGELLASYDIGVLCSNTESGPIALIEYLAAGLPFVVTDVGEIPASLPHPLRRWVVPARNSNAIAVALRDLFALSAAERASLADAGFEFVREHLSIERTVDSLEDVYLSLLRP